LPGGRDNARNSARCTQARKTTHGLDGQHQDVDRTPRGQGKQRTGINGVSTSMVWPYLGSRTAKEQNKTEHLDGEVGGDELVAMTTAAASQTGARKAVLETDVT